MVFYLLSWNIGVAQESEDGRITRKGYQPGTILSSVDGKFTDTKYFASSQAYDPLVFGIATGNDAPRRKSDFFTEEGVVWVRYNLENGVIVKDDLITSSSEPGEAMKAAKSGFIVGLVLESPQIGSNVVKTKLLFQYINF